MSVLRPILGSRFQVECVLPNPQRERQFAIDVKVVGVLVDPLGAQLHGPASAILEMHPRRDRLARRRVDDFDQ
jgi:hypothetical protein